MVLAPRSQWDLIGDEEMMAEEQNLRVSDISHSESSKVGDVMDVQGS